MNTYGLRLPGTHERIEVREDDQRDASTVREIWVENVYRVNPPDFGGGACVDLGANIGAFVLYALRLGAGRVVALEPCAANLKLLRKNASGPRVEIIRAAAWSRAGETELVVNGRDSKLLDEIPPAPGGGDPVAGFARETVPTMTLADVLSQHGLSDVAVLKLDVESAEYEIFAGATDEVVGRFGYIVLEFHSTTDARFGALCAQLAHTHCVQTLGHPARGGYIYARRY